MKKDFNAHPLKIFSSYIMAHKGLFLADMLCAVVASAIDLCFPFVSRMSMNRLLPEKLYTAFFVIMGVMVLAYLGKAILYYIITVIGHRMGVLVESDMRRDIFTHMQDLSCSFYDKNRTGMLMSRITTELFDITELAHHGPDQVYMILMR